MRESNMIEKVTVVCNQCSHQIEYTDLITLSLFHFKADITNSLDFCDSRCFTKWLKDNVYSLYSDGDYTLKISGHDLLDMVHKYLFKKTNPTQGLDW